MSYIERVQISGADSPTIDAFARMRVSNPRTIFDSKQLDGKQSIYWDESLTGTATSTHIPVDACTRMTVAATGDKAIRQTKMYHNYQPGKSQLLFMTFTGQQDTNVSKKIGMWDGNNGIYLEILGSDVTLNVMKDGSVTETVSKASWNVDKFDGTGLSGTTLDFTRGQIFWLDMEWLGVGRVRCGFVYRGVPYVAHQFVHSNEPTFTSVYMSNPNLPLRYEIESLVSNGSGTLDHICASIMSEGGFDVNVIPRGIDNGGTGISFTANQKKPLVAVRLKSTNLFSTTFLKNVSILCTSAATFRWFVSFNPTASGTELDDATVYTSISESAMEYKNTFTNTITDEGIVLASGYVLTGTAQVGFEIDSFLRLGSTIAGERDVLVLGVQSLSGANETMYGSIVMQDVK